MIALGIETSCDETAAAVVARDKDGHGRILSNIILSQAADHAAFGGVVPEIAARAHVEALDSIIAAALDEADIALDSLDAIAATAGPGLIGGVIVGLTTAKALALAAGKPLIAVNHLEGHALTARLTDNLAFPYLLLLVSGGHTQFVAVEDVGVYRRLGTTIDDAIGEAFDKAAKLLGLGYPGGPTIEAAASDGDGSRFALPRPLAGKPRPDFSLSGLKTAVRLAAEDAAPLSDGDIADLAASFQAAVVDTVVDRSARAMSLFADAHAGLEQPTLVIAGGVAANQSIRAALTTESEARGFRLVAPPQRLCTDNGAMIAWAGIERLTRGLTDDLTAPARPRWPLDAANPSAVGGGAKGAKA
ncbi:tRNA (adenosine(37)-N6)-threonylcarbamoyltransferase complex transferase subunit TsaD [Bauldia sp.]|uniref:tRNA (adenosine(37)-N6)-threonylcarbamoyltransferase complex transferase subunit TsaD n=1 Tax=Bauldia sp. TaxID=2575872 RepID=UPI003BAC87D2